MIKKFIVLIFLFFTLVPVGFAAPNPADTAQEDTILGALAIFLNSKLYTSPKWFKVLDYYNIIVLAQLNTDMKEVGGMLITKRHQVDKFNYPVSTRYWDLSREKDIYVYEYLLRDEYNGAPTYRYEVSGNRIYKYDRPENGWFRQTFWKGEVFEPGNVVAYYDILEDEGAIVKYDPQGNKQLIFMLTEDLKHILLVDTDTRIHWIYKPISQEEYMPRYRSKSLAAKSTTTSKTSSSFNSSIVPLLAAIAQSDNAKNFNWAGEFNEASNINQYSGNGNSAGSFRLSDKNITQYDAKGNRSGSFYISGKDVTIYNANGNRAGSMYVSGKNATLYDANGNRTGSFFISGKDGTMYDADGNRAGSFYISGSDITQYDANGNRTFSYRLF